MASQTIGSIIILSLTVLMVAIMGTALTSQADSSMLSNLEGLLQQSAYFHNTCLENCYP